MTQPSIKPKIESTKAAAAKAATSRSKWAWWSGYAHILIAGIAVVLAGGTGLGGSSVTSPVGRVVAPQADEAKVAAEGWRAICFSVAGLAALAYLAGKINGDSKAETERANSLHASLKNLLIDLEDFERDPKEVARDYQRLVESFPEFKD